MFELEFEFVTVLVGVCCVGVTVAVLVGVTVCCSISRS